ncbi:hypothetical protein LU196_16065 [Pantoea sp. Mb-10]|uniref:hypothetical protein n=1 Tax=unclassified Pantoea TaxID=2630326 RepID=UPI001E3CAB26|nr:MULTISPECIES: hypothetical protein [unclassified Pantoea]MCE0491552.1 hypothetical protein [Pantoea sp. Mb-10]MCE0502366.1 hypothetical protein [Pantoea sp. Pb-8]
MIIISVHFSGVSTDKVHDIAHIASSMTLPALCAGFFLSVTPMQGISAVAERHPVQAVAVERRPVQAVAAERHPVQAVAVERHPVQAVVAEPHPAQGAAAARQLARRMPEPQPLTAEAEQCLLRIAP